MKDNIMTVSSPSLESSTALTPLTLGDLWHTLMRHFLLIAIIIAACVALGVVYLKNTPKLYEAKSVLLIDTQEKNVEIQSVLSELSNDQSLIPSEIQVLLSRDLMQKTLTLLNIINHPEKLLGATQKEPMNDIDIVGAALENLTVKQIDKSRAISVVFQSINPSLAAEVVNTLTEMYIKQQINQNFEAVRVTNSWLGERVDELQEKVRLSEQKIADYRAQAGLVNNKGNALVEQNMSELSSKLIDAKAKLADAQARLAEVKGGAGSAPSVLQSILIQNLRARESDARNRLAAMAERLGPEHPQIMAARAEVNEIEQKIREEIAKVSEGLKRDYQVAQNNVSFIQSQINSLKGQYNSDTSDNVELAALEREAEINRKFLETLNLRWKETQSQEDSRLQTPYARVLSKAMMPDKPSSPNTMLVLLTALLAGVGLGGALALSRDQMQNTFYNGKQLQSITGLTNISMMAQTGRTKPTIKTFADLPVIKPNTPYMEGVRDVSAFLKLEKSKNPSVKVFAMTSSYKGEGKSALCTSLARQLALEGQKVIAVDCDIREPALTRAYGLQKRIGLTDILAGTVTVMDAIHTDTRTSLSLLPIGDHQRDVNLMVNGVNEWQSVIDKLSENYDFILLDAPPVLVAPEAKIVAKLGTNILCVRWKKTPIAVVAFALDTLKRLHAPVCGTVITRAKGKNVSGKDSF